jgi:hypothetical protein
MTENKKLDLTKLHKLEYSTPKTPRLITVGKGKYVAIEGMGPPGSEVFQERMGALYASAYTIKFASKEEGKDFVVCKLESLYWLDGHDESDFPDFSKAPKDTWRWRFLIRMPDCIGSEHLASATEKIRSKGETPGLDDLHMRVLDEGQCIQMLHVGPYDQEEASISQMKALAREEGLAPLGPHHEIYLSDPRRVEPARLKTILRMPVRPE